MKKSCYLTTLFLLFLAVGNIDIKGENLIKTNIIGHWNYPPNSVQTIYVESEGDDVELFINGISFGHGKRDSESLFRFDNVIFQPGDLTAVSYNENGSELSRQNLRTAGTPAQLELTVIENPDGFRANGADIAEIQFKVADFQGNRCGNDERIVTLEIDGPAEFIEVNSKGEYYPSNEKSIKVENGKNSAIVRSEKTAGKIIVNAKAKGLAPVSVTFNSTPVE